MSQFAWSSSSGTLVIFATGDFQERSEKDNVFKTEIIGNIFAIVYKHLTQRDNKKKCEKSRVWWVTKHYLSVSTSEFWKVAAGGIHNHSAIVTDILAIHLLVIFIIIYLDFCKEKIWIWWVDY